VRVNQRVILINQRRLLLLLAGLIIFGATAAVGLAQTFKVVQSKQQLYAAPNFSANALGSVPEGTEVQIIQQSGEWYQVEYQGQQGWLSQQAFPGGKKFDLSNLLKGKAVQESKTDEVALAGKGFTPEVEADYRQKHPNLNYAQVDQVEKFEVNPAQLQTFQREGGLQ
jgi:Bacterial SH3 domain